MATERDDYLLRIQVAVQNDKALTALTRQMDTAAKSAPRTQRAVQQTGKSTANFGRVAQNTSFQLQDLIVQIQGGTDPLRAFGQQLPQMLVGFSGIGVAIAGLTAAALPALISFFRETSEKLATLEDATGKSATAWGDYADALDRVGESGDKVDTVISRVLKSVAQSEQAAALEALRRDADQLVQSARSLAEVPGVQQGTFWSDLKDLTTEAADTFLTGGLAGLITDINEFSRGLAQVDRFAGAENLAEFERLIDDLNKANIGQTIEGLANLADRMEGVASPTAVDQIRQYAVELQKLRTSANDVGGVLQEVDLRKINDRVKPRTLEDPRTLETITPFAGDPEIIAKFAQWQEQLSDEISRSNELFRQFNPEVAKYRDLVFDLDEALRLGVMSQADYDARLAEADKNLQESLEGWTLGKEAVEVFDQSFQTMLDGVLQGTTDLSEGIKNMVRVMIAELGKLAAYQFIANAFAGTTFGDAAASLLPSAKGNAFNNGSVTAFARGGVVNGPTVFPMASGMGLMGEAGPEAVMPLRRNAQGRLGVEAAMPNITINNNAPGVEVSPRQTDNGLTIDVVMSQMALAVLRGGNPVSDAMERTYTLGRGQGVY